MGYEVLARKWRPGTFDDVVGQEHVTQTLQNAVESDRIAHAYLFVGPRGIGKTSIARIFAKTLNCQAPEGVKKPCCECDSCREIAEGNSLDVLEIDGASNNGVEQVRELRETVVYAPSRGPYKIYIIDEVHMLSAGAFNALLKTLEEPPPHVKFMFATTEPEKILPTIISRCQRFDLRRISTPKIVERLQLIADTEGITVSSDALLAIARGAEGGLRDAESAFDQLISFCGKDITEDNVLSVFGLVSKETLDKLGFAVLQGDIPTIISLLSDLDNNGKDMQRLAMELMTYFRALLICLNVKDPSSALDLTDSQLETLTRHAAHTNTSKVLRVITFLEQAIDKMRYALSRRVLLEVALIRSGKAAVTVSLDEILAQLNELKKNLTASGLEMINSDNSKKKVVETKISKESSQYESEGYVEMYPGLSDSDALQRLTGNWKSIVGSLANLHPLISGALHDSRPVKVANSVVVIEIDQQFKADLDKLSDVRNKHALEMALKDELGRDVSVELRVSASPYEHRTVEQFSAADVGTDYVGAEKQEFISTEVEKGDLPKSPAETKKSNTGTPGGVKTPQEWIQEVPEIRTVLEVFNGMITDIR